MKKILCVICLLLLAQSAFASYTRNNVRNNRAYVNGYNRPSANDTELEGNLNPNTIKTQMTRNYRNNTRKSSTTHTYKNNVRKSSPSPRPRPLR